MIVRYLLDTNTARHIIKGKDPGIRRRLVEVPMALVAVSTVTEGVLRYGVARQPAATRLQKVVNEFLLRTTILQWDSGAAQEYGRLRAVLEGEGQTMGNLEMMIGAHALASDLILVTHDKAFKRIDNLKIEDWTKP